MFCSVQTQRGLTNHGRLTALAYVVMLVIASLMRTRLLSSNRRDVHEEEYHILYSTASLRKQTFFRSSSHRESREYFRGEMRSERTSVFSGYSTANFHLATEVFRGDGLVSVLMAKKADCSFHGNNALLIILTHIASP